MRASFASGSVFDACVSLLRLCPLKSAQPLLSQRRPRLDERPVRREVLVADQVRCARLLDDDGEELASSIVCQQSLLVLGERAVIERVAKHVEIKKPAEQQVVAELLAELALGSNREQRRQELRLQQHFWRH